MSSPRTPRWNRLDLEVGWLTVSELPLQTLLPSDTFAVPPSPAP